MRKQKSSGLHASDVIAQSTTCDTRNLVPRCVACASSRGSRVLDASGPQWLTFALALQHTDIEFYYINVSIPVEEILALQKLSAMADTTPRLVNAALHLSK